jgi:hypothetical protein
MTTNTNTNYGRFFTQLTGLVGGLDTNDVKDTIGDSTNNNRTLTVRQVIRFLSSSNNPRFRSLGKRLAEVYGLLRPVVTSVRSSGRTDAVDINELLSVFEEEVISAKNSSLRRSIGHIVGN